jgi:hypothetical protein
MSGGKKDPETERELDQALEQTFPASDPVAVADEDKEPVRPVDRRPAPLDRATVDRLAEQLDKRKKAGG